MIATAMAFVFVSIMALTPAGAGTPPGGPGSPPPPTTPPAAPGAPPSDGVVAPAPAPAAAPSATDAASATAGSVAGRGRIRGVVTDPDRQPVGGRLVVLVSHAEGEALRVTSTDEKGRYQFHDLAPGKYEIRLEAEGFVPETKKDIEVRPPFQNVVDVTLRRVAPGASSPAAAPGTAQGQAAPATGTEIVQGMLRDGEGTPVAEAEVLLAPLAGAVLRQGTSDEHGAFRIEGVAPGAYRLIVRSLGHVPIDVSRVDVVSGSGLSLRLMLVDYALSFISDKDVRPILERPRPRQVPGAPPASGTAPASGTTPASGAPPAPGTPAVMRAPAPEPEPDPLVPGPPEEKSTTPPPADGGTPSS